MHTSEVDQHGNVHVDAYMDAADGRDLDEAVARRAKLRGQLGDTDSLDARRARAAGEVIAESPGRRVELHVHLTGESLTGDNPVGRCDELRTPVQVAQIKEWLLARHTTVTVRPVIDLADCLPVDSWEIPDRHKQRVHLRDHSCRFPNCPKPAVNCDLDHHTPYGEGGPTCPCNLVPLCRRHHRAKTFSAWRYQVIQPGHYLWTSPHGHLFHVGPAGTTPLDGY